MPRIRRAFLIEKIERKIEGPKNRENRGSGLKSEPPSHNPAMIRPLRIEFPGAVYHVTSRGDRREAIYEDDADAALFLNILGQACERFKAKVLAYCLMTNHYHLVVVTPNGGLSLLMRHINGVYSQGYNRRHGVVGHVFQGRFKAILVDRDAYLMEVQSCAGRHGQDSG